MLVHECSVGAAETAAPPERTSVFREFRGRTLRSLTICVHLCHLWENYQVGGVGMAGMPYPPKCVLWAVHAPPWGENTKRAWRNAMPSYVSYVDAWEVCQNSLILKKITKP